jgi:acetoin utilization protein AcuB
MMRILVELVGARDRGSWVEVEVPNEPGQLANVTDVIREKKVNIGGVFLTPAHRASNRLIVLRLDTTNPSGIVKAFETAGYNVTTVEASRNPEPTLEES